MRLKQKVYLQYDYKYAENPHGQRLEGYGSRVLWVGLMMRFPIVKPFGVY